jgi:hypothetical protein
MGKELGRVAGHGGKLCGQRLHDAVMMLLPRALEQRFIRGLLDEDVLERVCRLWWQAMLVQHLGVDEPAQRWPSIVSSRGETARSSS